MKITCLETFEKGMNRLEGGMIKMSNGQSFSGEVTEHGVLVTIQGKNRLLQPTLIDELAKLGVIRVTP